MGIQNPTVTGRATALQTAELVGAALEGARAATRACDWWLVRSCPGLRTAGLRTAALRTAALSL